MFKVTFWFLLKTNLVTSFIMVQTNPKVQQARDILFRSFLVQYACEVIYFISYYIYMSVTDSLDEQCDRFYDNHFMQSQQGIP